MNDDDFQFLIAVAQLPKLQREAFLAEAGATASARDLSGLSKEVLDGLRKGNCSGAAASVWLSAVSREAKTRERPNGRASAVNK